MENGLEYLVLLKSNQMSAQRNRNSCYSNVYIKLLPTLADDPLRGVVVELIICTMATLRLTLRAYTLTNPRQLTIASM